MLILFCSCAAQVITFGFDRFQTYIGPGISRFENTKNCQLGLGLKVRDNCQQRRKRRERERGCVRE